MKKCKGAAKRRKEKRGKDKGKEKD